MPKPSSMSSIALRDVDAPVDADDVAAGLLHQIEHRRRAIGEVDDGHAALGHLAAVSLTSSMTRCVCGST